jgi:hypothetical protein
MWSLLGLTIPIAIHLLSRKEGKVIKLGSVRHVRETSTQQFKGIKLNEILLLALRCAMIVVFSLLLSGMQCTGSSGEKIVFVESGIDSVSFLKTMIDSLKKDGYTEESFRIDSTRNYWAIADQIRTKQFSSAIVFAQSKLTEFEGRRVSLPPNVKWITVPPSQKDFLIQSIQSGNETVSRKGHSQADETYFTNEITTSSGASSTSPDSLRILLVSDQAHAYDLKMMEAALDAISKSFPIKMLIIRSTSTKSEIFDWTIWLSDDEKPNQSNLISMSVDNSKNLFTQTGRNEWQVTHRLDEEIALKENLTLKLAEILLPHEKQERVAKANDVRVMPDSMAWSSEKNQKANIIGASTPANRILIICLLALFLVERIVAYKRNL